MTVHDKVRQESLYSVNNKIRQKKKNVFFDKVTRVCLLITKSSKILFGKVRQAFIDDKVKHMSMTRSDNTLLTLFITGTGRTLFMTRSKQDC